MEKRSKEREKVASFSVKVACLHIVLYRAVPGPVSDWYQPVGVGREQELSWGTKWGAPCGGALGSGLGTCVGLFVSLSSADCYCMARIDERFSGKTLFVM